jgi:hypothetical protein
MTKRQRLRSHGVRQHRPQGPGPPMYIQPYLAAYHDLYATWRSPLVRRLLQVHGGRLCAPRVLRSHPGRGANPLRDRSGRPGAASRTGRSARWRRLRWRAATFGAFTGLPSSGQSAFDGARVHPHPEVTETHTSDLTEPARNQTRLSICERNGAPATYDWRSRCRLREDGWTGLTVKVVASRHVPD